MTRRIAIDLALIVGVFVLCTAIAELAGAPNLGTALTFGQIGFGLAVVFVMARR
jgi:hypothetical protein